MAWTVEILDEPQERDWGTHYGGYRYDCDAVAHCGGAGPITSAEMAADPCIIRFIPKGWTFGSGNKCYCPEHAHMGNVELQASLF